MSIPKHTFPYPVFTDHYIHIYNPQEDVYTLETRTPKRGEVNFSYEQGQSYKEWRTNDHTFIRDDQNRWHCFGITKPWLPGDNSHAGEGLCFHALGPQTASGKFADAIQFQSWIDQPKISEGGVGWAPSAIKVDNQYNLVSSQLDRMVSDDLENWTYAGKLAVDLNDVGGDVRDPHISLIDGVYHMVMCCSDKVGLSTSKDLVTWSKMKVIFKPENDNWRTESPFLVPYNGSFYLFWCLWDKGDSTCYGYSTRSYVQCSQTLEDFNGPAIQEFHAHAPRVIKDEDGSWFMSSTDYPHKGISVIRFNWSDE